MTHPRPEFVVGSSSRWKHTDDEPLHGERRADPLRRTTRADHGDGDEARTSRLLALVAGTHDGRQRRSTPARWLADRGLDRAASLRVWDAAQDARNRATVREVYGEALPLPVVPANLAKRHVLEFERHAKGEPVNSEVLALEVLAIIDDREAFEQYHATLERIAPEYARAARELRYVAHGIGSHSHPRNLRGTERIVTGSKRLRVSKAHAEAYLVATEAIDYAYRNGKNAAGDAHERRRRETVEQSYKKAATPPQGPDTRGEPPAGAVRYSRWHKLVPHEPERPVAHSGRCGRTRTATITGRVPRYLSRLITDPERRVFSRTTRGTRALVVVDLSGSMSLEASDLDRILEASVGATVVGYAAHNDTNPNTLLLAHRGRRVRHVPRYSGGNGVDAPAFVYACRRFATSSTPILWITDCEAVGNAGQTFEVLDECRKVAAHYGARIERTVEHALEALADLRRGRSRPSNSHRFLEVARAKGYEKAEAV